MAIISNFSEKMKTVFKADPLKPIFQDFINQGFTSDDLLETIGYADVKPDKSTEYRIDGDIP